MATIEEVARPQADSACVHGWISIQGVCRGGGCPSDPVLGRDRARRNRIRHVTDLLGFPCVFTPVAVDRVPFALQHFGTVFAIASMVRFSCVVMLLPLLVLRLGEVRGQWLLLVCRVGSGSG